MKSTYNLIGVYWDGQPDAQPIAPVPFDPSFRQISEPRCLFDFIEDRRRISLSDVLSAESDEDIACIASEFASSNLVAVILDCAPQTHGLVQERFYMKRARQAIGRLQRSLPNARVLAMLPPSDAAGRP